jgi:hypothetical protein
MTIRQALLAFRANSLDAVLSTLETIFSLDRRCD